MNNLEYSELGHWMGVDIERKERLELKLKNKEKVKDEIKQNLYEFMWTHG